MSKFTAPPMIFQVGEAGASLVTTLLLLLSLSVLGLAALNVSRTDTQLVANDNLHKQLFIAAEAGLETGRGQIGVLPAGANLDALLANPAPALQVIPAPGMPDVYYRFQFVDDDDGDANFASDTNGIVLIRSWGLTDDNPVAPPFDAQVVLEAGYFRPQAGAAYAQENVDAGNTNATASAQNVDLGVSGAFN